MNDIEQGRNGERRKSTFRIQLLPPHFSLSFKFLSDITSHPFLFYQVFKFSCAQGLLKPNFLLFPLSQIFSSQAPLYLSLSLAFIIQLSLSDFLKRKLRFFFSPTQSLLLTCLFFKITSNPNSFSILSNLFYLSSFLKFRYHLSFPLNSSRDCSLSFTFFNFNKIELPYFSSF